MGLISRVSSRTYRLFNIFENIKCKFLSKVKNSVLLTSTPKLNFFSSSNKPRAQSPSFRLLLLARHWISLTFKTSKPFMLVENCLVVKYTVLWLVPVRERVKPRRSIRKKRRRRRSVALLNVLNTTVDSLPPRTPLAVARDRIAKKNESKIFFLSFSNVDESVVK